MLKSVNPTRKIGTIYNVLFVFNNALKMLLPYLNTRDIDFPFSIRFFGLIEYNTSPFLAYLSRRLECAIVIAHRPSVRLSSSVNFHIFDFFSRTAWWILMKLGRDEVLMVPYKCCCFSASSAQGRTQGGAKIGHGGPLLQECSFSSDRKATATNRMHSNDIEAFGKKCCYFWFHSEIKFLTRFDVFLDLVILPYFNAISMDFMR